MKKQGREPKPLTDEERQLVKTFLENDMSYAEYAEQVGLTKPQLRYRVSKYQKEMTENGKTEQIN